ncbi:MAG: PEP-CTERM sorting domain-containing protein [Chthoniobacterales bacterium]
MKKILLVLLAAAPATSWSQLITVGSLNNIQYWTGSGTNRAALVLQFGASATPTSIAWGYRWNGSSATAATMLFSLAGTITGSSAPAPLLGADPRLSVDVSFFSGFGGYFVNTISYNQSGLPAPWGQLTRNIKDDYFGDGTYPTLYSLNSTGLWSSSFALAQVGMSQLLLTNGAWIGFVQSDGVADPLGFTQPVAAVPEPTSLALLGAGGAVAATIRFARRRKGA